MNQVLEEYARTGLILEGVECLNAKDEPTAQGPWVHLKGLAGSGPYAVMAASGLAGLKGLQVVVLPDGGGDVVGGLGFDRVYPAPNRA